MQQPDSKLSVTWRGKNFILEMNPGATLKELGDKLQKLTNVKADTLRLIVPTGKSSKLFYPYSDEHFNLPLETASFLEGKSIRMMGVPQTEVDEIIQNSRTDLRIAGFDEEEKRMRRKISDGNYTLPKLPQGNYIFAEFQTLNIPGIELNPPASEALKLMHRLAADPGIIAIMNKHRWRIGIMTEMAPVGYVGVSPKCILGFNKIHGEEISLRLRTDDLNGFRKYESIKKTLLHELAHMVYSEHDTDFYALDKQLNEEAATLDWTKSKGHTLSEITHSPHSKEEFANHPSSSRTLGGQASSLSTARASSVAAAYQRYANSSINTLRMADIHEEPDPDDSGLTICLEPDCVHAEGKTETNITDNSAMKKILDVLDSHQNQVEPGLDGSEGWEEAIDPEPCVGSGGSRVVTDIHADESLVTVVPTLKTRASEEPAPMSFEVSVKDEVMGGQDHWAERESMENLDELKANSPKRDSDESGAGKNGIEYKDKLKPHYDDGPEWSCGEPDPDDSQSIRDVQMEPKPDIMLIEKGMLNGEADEPDPDDMELQRIQDPVIVICGRLQKAIEMLRSELNPMIAASVLETMFKIVRNVIENPDEMKFRKLRKANPIILRNVVSCQAAMEILRLIGFSEEVVFDALGNAETYFVLNRNDPGLLWLVKNSLESFSG